ncbi:MAG: hypothetical protein EOP84_00310 [Verrucomicrobiaceae bacterium]|nr:MAG: hypothetical protein EOP84_00310 [Verrucomicrobiaceae bacterium]
MRFLIGCAVALCVSASTGSAIAQGSNQKPKTQTAPKAQPQSPHAACVKRGVEYFKEIGSYPRLSDGRDAAKVADERCGRTLTAF